ncbi:hypothetical protein M9Y10_023043 [Tritrichomonas musculus]|uniref:C2 NT-type domain-containing protein n=1 Tax=Tritrichomonas musculus TaxID=1915356 RepID=A0ABR2KV04_9EUKA
MTGKATLYFAVNKVTAPARSTIQLVLSVGDTKVTLSPPRSTRGTNYNIPYKISREVTNSPEGSSSYRSCVVQINFLDGEIVTSTGSVRIKPDEFINASKIELRDYPIPVADKENVSANIGISLIPDGGAAPSNYGEFEETAKIIATEQRQDQSDSSSHHSHHRSSQPPVEQPSSDQMEGAEDIVESESGKKHRRRKGTKDTKDGTFISDGGTVHKRRRHRTAQLTDQPPSQSEPTPPPADPPGEPSSDQMEGAEDIVESESGKKHRRKKGTKDTKDGTFISDGGTVHKRRRHRKPEENSGETKPEEKKDEVKEEVKTKEVKTDEKIENPPENKEIPPSENKKDDSKSESKQDTNKIKSEEKTTTNIENSSDNKNEKQTENNDQNIIENAEEPKIISDNIKLEQDDTLVVETTQENQKLVSQVAELKNVVEKQTNWIRSLYSKLLEHSKANPEILSKTMKQLDFASLPIAVPDLNKTQDPKTLLHFIHPQSNTESPSSIADDNQKACQTGEINHPPISQRGIQLFLGENGVNNVEEERYENHDDYYDDGPLRRYHFSMNEYKDPEEPIISTPDGLTLSYSIRNDCFFRPHYNFEMLDISGRFSFEVFQSPFEIEKEGLSIECKFNPTIEFNSGDGGYPDSPVFSPTRSRFNTEHKGPRYSYFTNENQETNQSYNYHTENYPYSMNNINNDNRNDTKPYSPTRPKLTVSENDQATSQAQNKQYYYQHDDKNTTSPAQDNDYGQYGFNSTFSNTSNFNNPHNPFNYDQQVKPSEINENNNDENNDAVKYSFNYTERNIQLDSNDDFPNSNQSVSPNYSPSSSQNISSSFDLSITHKQLQQKLQQQMEKQQKQIKKQMDELYQLRQELNEQQSQMNEQFSIQMQKQLQEQQKAHQNMQIQLEKKKQQIQFEIENERKQMNHDKQVLELQMEREKQLMESEREKMEKERQNLLKQRQLQEEELLQLKNQRDLQQKEMQQLQILQHKQQQQQELLQQTQGHRFFQPNEQQQSQQETTFSSPNQQFNPQQTSQTQDQQQQALSDPNQQQEFSSSVLNQNGLHPDDTISSNEDTDQTHINSQINNDSNKSGKSCNIQTNQFYVPPQNQSKTLNNTPGINNQAAASFQEEDPQNLNVGNFKKKAPQNSDNERGAVDNNNTTQTHYAEINDNDIDLLYKGNSNSPDKKLTSNKPIGPPLFDKTHETSPIGTSNRLNKKSKSSNDMGTYNNNFDDDENNKSDEELFNQLDQPPNSNIPIRNPVTLDSPQVLEA